MKLARYWARDAGEAVGRDGQRVRVTARGWSHESLDAARALAREIARRVATRLATGTSEGRQYLYGERPMPEPVLREFADGSDELRAVVTRNAYGALVLNARDLMFVDIDREDGASVPKGSGDLLAGVLSLFGKSAPAAAKAEADPVLASVRRVAESNRVAARLYKTAAGYRAIITSAGFGAGAGSSEALLERFGADPLYVRLCRLQQSFRARLTPKPWRCGLSGPPVGFPFDSPEAEARFRTWEAAYTATAARYATCRYLTAVGGEQIVASLEDLVRYHDQETKATSDLPLA